MKRIIAYTILISVFILSVIKISDIDAPEETDKLVHITMYFFVAMSFYFLNFKRYIIAALTFGFLIEIIQYFIPYRSFSLFDIFANLIGVLIFYFFIKYRERQSKCVE